MLNYDNTGVTVELGDIIASGVDIWAFEYPTPASMVVYNGKTAKVPFDKAAFEKKITDHYRFRQIGQETVGRWLHYFRTRMCEIMPYYVQLYEFEAKWRNIDDPLESYNLTETFEQETTGNGTSTGTNSATGTVSSEQTGENKRDYDSTEDVDDDSTTKFSDTPQGSVDNLDDYLTTATVVNNLGYKTVVGNDKTTITDTSETGTESSGQFSETKTDSGTSRHTLTRKGNIGVQPLGGEVKNIREAFINIDLMVINELKDLFLQVY